MQPDIMMTDSDEENKTPDIPCCQPQMPVLAELLCLEVSDHELIERGLRSLEHCDEDTVMSYFDSAVLYHPEVMTRLKFLESQIETPKSYFHSDGKNEITPHMRKRVAKWMFDVCEELGEQVDEAVFPLAVSILDQFLSDCLIKKEQLQLAACVCLLLASKTRQNDHFSIETLCFYTANSVSPQTLKTWELAILSQLDWDINYITAFDFVDFILFRTACDPYKSNKHGITQTLRNHTMAYLALCSTEPRFVGQKPSLMATSAIYAAARGLYIEDADLAGRLSEMVSVPEEQLRLISASIAQAISSEMKAMEQEGLDVPLAQEMMIAASSAASKGNSCTYSSVSGETQISEEVLV